MRFLTNFSGMDVDKYSYSKFTRKQSELIYLQAAKNVGLQAEVKYEAVDRAGFKINGYWAFYIEDIGELGHFWKEFKRLEENYQILLESLVRPLTDDSN